MKINSSIAVLAVSAVAVCFVGCSKEKEIIKIPDTRPRFVDLGLSVKWAEANLGASVPEETGGYYAFAETQTKDEYSMMTYKWGYQDAQGLWQYSKYVNDGRTVLDREDDAVVAQLGSQYCIPSAEQMRELMECCVWTWSELNGMRGYKVESAVPGFEGRYIFLPACGLREGSDSAVTGFEGYYITRTKDDTGPDRLAFSPQGIVVSVTGTREYGFSIRPVTQTPSPVVSQLKVFTDDFPVREFTCKESAAHGKIFVESGTSSRDTKKGYNPYMLCLDSNGKVLWNWAQISRRTTVKSANWTMYDITPDGGIIDCFNAITGSLGEEGDINNPFVAKLDAYGNPVWGSDPYFDIPLYEFKGDFLSHGPVGSYTVCDKDGGAWVASWNSPNDDDIFAGKVCSQMVFVHLDKDGNKISQEIAMDNAGGTCGKRGIVSRAQMYTADDGTLFALVLYITIGTVSDGYYDLLKIFPDGKSVDRQTLMSARSILGDIRAKITKDGRGGAYVTCAAVNMSDEMNRLWMYHIDASGSIDTKDIDLTPEYCTFGIRTEHAVDPATGNLAVLFMDSYPIGERNARKRMSFILVNSKGEKIVSDSGKPIVIRRAEGKNQLSTADFKAIYRPETGKIFVSYIYEGYMMQPAMKAFEMDFEGNASEDRTLFEIDRHYYGNNDTESQIYDFVDGNLLYFFSPNASKTETRDFFGYVLKTRE